MLLYQYIMEGILADFWLYIIYWITEIKTNSLLVVLVHKSRAEICKGLQRTSISSFTINEIIEADFDIS